MRIYTTMACMSDQGSVVDNLSFDDYDPSPGSLDFFEDFVDQMAESGLPNEDDVYAQLEQKEKDLILAAELGKALLERNEELTKRQEQMQQELADKFEESEQEKHHLRRRLETVGSEYESKLLDLQTEISSVHQVLANQKAAQKTAESQKQSELSELAEQNQRLVHQLKKAADVEEELNEHIQRLRDQVHLRRQHSLNRETSHVTEDLQKEVQRLSAKRGELERRLHMATSERDTLASSLKDSNDRCVTLEKQSKDLQQQLGLRDTDLAKLRQVHNDTIEELEELHYQATLNASNAGGADYQGNSLLSELGFEMTHSGGGASLDGRDAEEENAEPDDDDIEYDVVDGPLRMEGAELRVELGGHLSCLSAAGIDGNESNKSDTVSSTCNIEQQTLQDVLTEVHSTLSKLVHELKAFQVTSSPIGSPCHSPTASTNERLCKEQTRPEAVRSLLRDLTNVTECITKQGDCFSQDTSFSVNDTQIEALESHIEALRGELSGTQSHIELLQAEIHRQNSDLKRKDSEISAISMKTRYQLSQILYSEVRSLERELELTSSSAVDCSTSWQETDLSMSSSDDDKLEERGSLSLVHPRRRSTSERLEDVSSNVSQEEVIDRLQSERDEAIFRQSVVEQQLCQAKADMSKLDDQLIGAIKQKVSLSEQLDEWQIDIHQLLDQRLKKQLTRQEVRKPDLKKYVAPIQKRFPFWS